MKRTTLSLFLTVTVALTSIQARAEPAPEELTPEARAEWAAAMVAYERGDLRAAIAGALKVFAAYPDPVADREIRHKIAGPLSVLWDSLYEQTQHAPRRAGAVGPAARGQLLIDHAGDASSAAPRSAPSRCSRNRRVSLSR